jgi:fatty-acyl-CoA synthase
MEGMTNAITASELLSKRAQLTPEREAMLDVESGRRYTYADLNQRANRLANFLAEELGVRKGDRVSILAYNNVVYLDLLYGLGKIGAIFAPLNWRLTAHELTYIVQDCDPKVLIYEPDFRDVVEEMRPVLSVEHYVSLAHDEALEYQTLLDQASPQEPQRPPLSQDDPYCILYTSGTTGRPKGAILPHRQVLWNCINTSISWGLTEHDVSPIFTPMFHAGGLFAFMTPILYVGGRIVLTRKFEVNDSLKILVDEKCTVILGVPTLFQMWMNAPYFEEADFSHVHFFISGGAPCPVSLMEAWREAKGVVFRQGYGLTEVGTNCFSMTDDESVPKSGSVGKPIFHSWMKLVNRENQPVPSGETGELLIAGPHVCLGYWNNPQASQESLEKQGDFPWPWFHTGDMARMDEDGFFYIVGRYKDMIISGGENVYAAEVEAVFREHPAVEDAALIGMPDERWGEVGLMVVILKAGQQSTQEALQSFCRSRLASFKVPKQVIFTDSLPYSPYGKVMKSELKRQFAA